MNTSEIISNVLDNMKLEFMEDREIEVFPCEVEDLTILGKPSLLLECACIVTEWDEGIYYNPENNLFFFHGELRTTPGETSTIEITQPLLPLLPTGLQEILKRVAETKISETITLDQGPYLLTFQ